MSMKKKYSSPQVRSFTILPAQIIATSVTVDSNKTVDEGDGGYSRQFWGIVDDDAPSSSEVKFPVDE